MKGYYLYNSEYDFLKKGEKLTGVEKKVMAQVETFNEVGLNCELLFSIHVIGNTLVKIAARMPFGTDHVVYPDIEKLRDADYLYIRRPYLVGYSFRQFLRRVRRQNPAIKIVMEIPTYPYDGEILQSGWKNWPILWRERYNRVRLKGLVDYIAVVADPELEMLWGIPVLHITNGIHVEKLPLRAPQDGDGTIRILCAAFFSRYHGMDRILNGMQQYYENGGTREIQLYLAGQGAALSELKAQAADSEHLKPRVHFLGMLDDRELNHYYDYCDLGISTLGLSRLGEDIIGAQLKTREYLAAGLPFFGDSRIDVFIGREVPFYKRVPYDESPIDMEGICQYYDTLYPDDTAMEKLQIARKMRCFAQENVEMKAALKEALVYFGADMAADARENQGDGVK